MIGLIACGYVAVLLFPLCHASVRDSRCRVLQYVHDLLIVGCLSDRSINPSGGGCCMWDKGDLIL